MSRKAPKRSENATNLDSNEQNIMNDLEWPLNHTRQVQHKFTSTLNQHQHKPNYNILVHIIAQ